MSRDTELSLHRVGVNHTGGHVLTDKARHSVLVAEGRDNAHVNHRSNLPGTRFKGTGEGNTQRHLPDSHLVLVGAEFACVHIDRRQTNAGMRHNVDGTEGSDDTLLRGDNPIFPYCFYAFFATNVALWQRKSQSSN